MERFVSRFSSSDTDKRKRYVALVDDVRDRGGEALIFSSMHESGQRELYLKDCDGAEQ